MSPKRGVWRPDGRVARRTIVAAARATRRDRYRHRQWVLDHRDGGVCLRSAFVLGHTVLPGEAWRSLAIGAAVASLLGITLFFGTWPPFNTIAALAVNVAVLVSLLWLRWPTEAALTS